jgi:RND family efflux transporter MFP subunit
MPTRGCAIEPLLRAFVLALSLGTATPGLAQVVENDLDCLVEPRWTVVVSAPESAVVDSVFVDRGDLIEKGQVIAMLESSVEEATVVSARARAEAVANIKASEARLSFETLRHERGQQLFEEGVVSDTEQDESESARLVAEADLLLAHENKQLAGLELRRAEALLERRTIRSPIDGVVVRRILSPGEYADPLDLLELAQIDPLLVEAFAPVSSLGQISVGDKGRVSMEEPVGGVHEAVVVVVDRVVDAASGTFRVRLELPNPDYALPAGLKCRVRF